MIKTLPCDHGFMRWRFLWCILRKKWHIIQFERWGKEYPKEMHEKMHKYPVTQKRSNHVLWTKMLFCPQCKDPCFSQMEKSVTFCGFLRKKRKTMVKKVYLSSKYSKMRLTFVRESSIIYLHLSMVRIHIQT